MIYHSKWNKFKSQEVCGMSILPIKNAPRGPAGAMSDEDIAAGKLDIVDEIILYFRPNLYHRNFELNGPADRTLLYGLLYVHFCLHLFQKHKTKSAAESALQSAVIANFPLPGESGFPLGGFYPKAASSGEAKKCREYLVQLRKAINKRIIKAVFKTDAGPSKWWMCHSKRKVLNVELKE